MFCLVAKAVLDAVLEVEFAAVIASGTVFASVVTFAVDWEVVAATG